MSASSFEITVWVGNDQYVETVGVLVASIAQEAGCPSADCATFAARVDAVVREVLPRERPPQELPVVVRRAGGPVEVVVGGRTLILDL